MGWRCTVSWLVTRRSVWGKRFERPGKSEGDITRIWLYFKIELSYPTKQLKEEMQVILVGIDDVDRAEIRRKLFKQNEVLKNGDFAIERTWSKRLHSPCSFPSPTRHVSLHTRVLTPAFPTGHPSVCAHRCLTPFEGYRTRPKSNSWCSMDQSRTRVSRRRSSVIAAYKSH